MIRGRMLGEVWSTRKARGLVGRKMALVAVDGSDQVIVAIDTLDAREGQEVLVALGSGARNVLKPEGDNRGILCDAAVAVLIDGGGDEGAADVSR